MRAKKNTPVFKNLWLYLLVTIFTLITLIFAVARPEPYDSRSRALSPYDTPTPTPSPTLTPEQIAQQEIEGCQSGLWGYETYTRKKVSGWYNPYTKEYVYKTIESLDYSSGTWIASFHIPATKKGSYAIIDAVACSPTKTIIRFNQCPNGLDGIACK